MSKKEAKLHRRDGLGADASLSTSAKPSASPGFSASASTSASAGQSSNSNTGHASTWGLIVVLGLIATLLGYNYFRTPFLKRFANQQQKAQGGQQQVATDLSPSPQPSQVKQVLAQFTPQQKIAQLMVYPLVVDQDLLSELESLEQNCPSCGSAGDSVEIDGDNDVDNDGLDEASASSSVKPSAANQNSSTLPNSSRSTWSHLAQFQPGAVILFGERISTASAQAAINQVKALGRIEAEVENATLTPLIAVDHEGGAVQRLSGSGFTRLPAWRQACQLSEAELKELYQQSAHELAQVGVELVLAPVLDLAHGPQSFLASRACLDQERLTQASERFIKAFARYQIMPVVKHFPGIGAATQDLHHGGQVIALGPEDTAAFSQTLQKYPNIGVLTSHVRLQDKLEGKPCSLSQECLQRFPTDFPQVLVLSDALDMQSALDYNGEEQLNLAQVARRAVLAGNHLLVFGRGVTQAELQRVLAELSAQYERDQEFKQVVDQHLQQVLQLKLEGKLESKTELRSGSEADQKTNK